MRCSGSSTGASARSTAKATSWSRRSPARTARSRVLPDTDASKKELNQQDPAIDAVRRAGDARRGQGARRAATSRRRSSSRSTRRRGWSTRTSSSTASSRAIAPRFAEIADGVAAADLDGDELDYRRAKDKTDKSLEIYKFYVNALYVALTRAIRNVYLIESDIDHPLLRLLDVRRGGGDGQGRGGGVEPRGLAEGSAQARAAGQAGAGRRHPHDDPASRRPVPWPVFDEARVRETLIKVFRDQVPGGKAKQQLYEYADLLRRAGARRVARERSAFRCRAAAFSSQRRRSGASTTPRTSRRDSRTSCGSATATASSIARR